MNELQKDLSKITRLILMIDEEELKTHYITNKDQINTAKSVGHIIDPTAYRNALSNGDFENAELQSELCKHLIEAKKVADRLHPSVKLQILTNIDYSEDT